MILVYLLVFRVFFCWFYLLVVVGLFFVFILGLVYRECFFFNSFIKRFSIEFYCFVVELSKVISGEECFDWLELYYVFIYVVKGIELILFK